MKHETITTDAAYSVAAEQLRAFIERLETERAQQAESKERENDIFAEAKSSGLMTRPIRTILKLRAQDPAKRAEEDAILETYKSALGMQ